MKRSLICSCLMLAGSLELVSTSAYAQQTPLSEYEKLLIEEAGATEFKGAAHAGESDAEPPVAPTTDTDPATLAQQVSTSLEKLLESEKSVAELEKEMSGVVSHAIGKGVDLNELRMLVDDAMDGVKEEKPELVSVEEAGATLQNIIEANRRLIEGDPKDDYIRQLNSELVDKTTDTEETSATAAVTSSVTSSAIAESSEVTGERRHSVRPGESLSYIAQKYYGSASAFTKIYQANREALSTPDLVLVGQSLLIPE